MENKALNLFEISALVSAACGVIQMGEKKKTEGGDSTQMVSLLRSAASKLLLEFPPHVRELSLQTIEKEWGIQLSFDHTHPSKLPESNIHEGHV